MAGFGIKELIEFFVYDPKYKSPNMELGEMIRVVVYCNFDFSTFPFDYQECDFSLYERNIQEWIILNAFKFYCKGQKCDESENGLINLPEQYEIPYKIRMKQMKTTNISYYGEGEKLIWSTTAVRFSLQRNTFGQLVGGFYLPTGLFAFLSLGSYIINPDSVRTTAFILQYYALEPNLKSILYLTGSWKNGAIDNIVFDNFQCIWFNH